LRGRVWHTWPLLLSVVSFSGLYMAVMAHLPYVIPVVPGLVVLTAIALAQLATLVSRMFKPSARAIHVQ